METDSQNNGLKTLEAQLRENYGKIVYSHKTQEKCADILSKRNNSIKNSQIILSALITTGLLVRVFKGEEWALIVSTILSAIQFGFTSFLREYNLGETIQKHSTAALELLDIREKYLSLLTDLKAGLLSPEIIVEKRVELQEDLSKTYKGSPRTFSKAYKEAQKALQMNDELTFSDEEIDKFLPDVLRKK
ncbi:SLATT domain-containing protein [Confluentibacter lentus]|uniref:SLATT domain-containing protein n=1 Tax=Confluentibacter lentus TaxID=1699412 RepID=UPI000C283EFA|nr:SLATT domain-containing protein [Confluentibacter lentus]